MYDWPYLHGLVVGGAIGDFIAMIRVLIAWERDAMIEAIPLPQNNPV